MAPQWLPGPPKFFLNSIWLEVYKFKIIVPTLKELHLWINYDGFLLKINAPALEYLHFRGTMYSDILCCIRISRWKTHST